jgi:hypothetical protein
MKNDGILVIQISKLSDFSAVLVRWLVCYSDPLYKPEQQRYKWVPVESVLSLLFYLSAVKKDLNLTIAKCDEYGTIQ